MRGDNVGDEMVLMQYVIRWGLNLVAFGGEYVNNQRLPDDNDEWWLTAGWLEWLGEHAEVAGRQNEAADSTIGCALASFCHRLQSVPHSPHTFLLYVATTLL